MRKRPSKKPTVGFIGRDTAATKMEAMRDAGIHVAASPAELGRTMAKVLRG